jgi:flagellar basal-body rod protein FlgG
LHTRYQGRIARPALPRQDTEDEPGIVDRENRTGCAADAHVGGFNNLANTNTTGFKQDRASFEDLLYQQVRQPGGSSSAQTQLPTGLQLGTGVRVVATAKNFEQGGQQQTGRALDVMVNGRGFFEVQMPDGSSAYTRDGSFKINQDSELVTNSGYPVQPGIQIPEGAQSVTIGTDGTISVKMADGAASVEVGALTLTDFVNPAGLQARGENLFLETTASGPAQNGNPGSTASAPWCRRWKAATSMWSKSWCR